VDALNSIAREKIVLFTLDEPRYALSVSDVVRVVRAVEITPLPKAPDVVFGVINFHGEIIPVIDIRKRFHLPQRDMQLEDQFIIARTSQRMVAIVVDSVNGVYQLEHHQIVQAGESFPYTEYLSGITSIDHTIILVNDLEKFISIEEEQHLKEAIAGDIQ
jgi:purine-binding chemotaxis protein CheW